jgi:hypothetical protein
MEYDLETNNGEVLINFPTPVMETFHISSPSCFERHYRVFEIDGVTDYTGDLYVNENGQIALDFPYNYVGERLLVKFEMTMQQPISTHGYLMPTVSLIVDIVNTGTPVEPVFCPDNWAKCAQITSTFGDDETTSVYNMFDGDLSTAYSANCEVNSENQYMAQISVYFDQEIPLQTVGLLVSSGDQGEIMVYDTAGVMHICAEGNLHGSH